MGKYKTFKYGDGTKYGAEASDNLFWGIEVDWDNDGVFDGSNEGPNAVAYFSSRGRRFFIKKGGMGFEHVDTGKAIIKLLNNDGRYDSNNTSSPLYPNVQRGRYIRVTCLFDGVVYPAFAGKIDDISYQYDRLNRYVTLICSDGWRWLRDEAISTAITRNVLTGTAISTILTNANWPSIWGSDIAAGDDIIPYFWEDNRSASAAINDLNDSEFGRFYIAGSGQAVFIGRNTQGTSVATYTEDKVLKDIDTPSRWEVDKNIVRVYSNAVIERAAVDIWTMRDVPFIADGDSLDLFANFTYENRPVAGQDLIASITANSAADGTGSDLSSGFTLTVLTAFSQTAKVRITNSSGSGGYPTVAKITGTALDRPNKSFVEFDGRAASTDQPRVFTLDSKHQQDIINAVGYASFLHTYLTEVDIFPTFQLEGRPALQLTPDITSQVSLDFDTLNIDTDYKIGYIEHSWIRENGQAFRTKFIAEPIVDLSAFWTFTASMGIDTIFAY